MASHILLLQLIRLHDTEAVARSCRLLKRHYPAARITLTATAAAQEVMAGSRMVDELLVLERPQGWLGTGRLTRRIRQARFDLVTLAYEEPRLPGQLSLELIAWLTKSPKLAWITQEGDLVSLPRWRLFSRMAAELLLLPLFMAGGWALGLILLGTTLLTDLRTRLRPVRK